MQIENDDRKFIIDLCRKIDIASIKNLLLTLESSPNGASHYMPRLNILLGGSITLNNFRNGHLHTDTVTAPGIYYCSLNGFQQSNSFQKRTSLSFCYKNDHLRIVYANRPHPETPHQLESMDRRVLIITPPLPESGRKLINCLEALYEEGEHAMARRLINELFLLTCKCIQSGYVQEHNRTNYIWENIMAYIKDHPYEDISRQKIARNLGISPGYVSKLARQYNNSDFISIVHEFRIKHAALLLSSSNLNLDEIAERSGFRYRSYFFKLFKKYYQVTPKEYRIKTQSRQRNIKPADE